jgi:hypothetical protein
MRRIAMILAVLLAPCCATAERVLVDGLAGYVNEHSITVGDVMSSMQGVRQKLIQKYKGDELKAKMVEAYKAAFNSIVAKYLILDAYNKRENKLPDWVVGKRTAEIIHDSFKDDRAELGKVLAKEGMSFEEWKKDVRDHLIVGVMKNEFVDKNIKVAPGLIREEFEKNRDKFKTPAKVKLSMIVVKKGESDKEMIEKRTKAENLRKKVEAGEDFAAVAKASSEDDKAKDGGNYGWIEVSSLRPEIAGAVKALKAGEVGESVETSDEIYICRVDELVGEKEPVFEEVQARIERELKMREAEKVFNAWVDRLRKEAHVIALDVDIFNTR